MCFVHLTCTKAVPSFFYCYDYFLDGHFVGFFQFPLCLVNAHVYVHVYKRIRLATGVMNMTILVKALGRFAFLLAGEGRKEGKGRGLGTFVWIYPQVDILPLCFSAHPHTHKTDDDLLQVAIMKAAQQGAPLPMAAMLSDLPPRFCTRQLGVAMMSQQGSATLGRGGNKARWVKKRFVISLPAYSDVSCKHLLSLFFFLILFKSAR